MSKEYFRTLMHSLYRNNQLFLPKGQTIEEWIEDVSPKEMMGDNKTEYSKQDELMLIDWLGNRKIEDLDKPDIIEFAKLYTDVKITDFVMNYFKNRSNGEKK